MPGLKQTTTVYRLRKAMTDLGASIMWEDNHAVLEEHFIQLELAIKEVENEPFTPR